MRPRRAESQRPSGTERVPCLRVGKAPRRTILHSVSTARLVHHLGTKRGADRGVAWRARRPVLLRPEG